MLGNVTVRKAVGLSSQRLAHRNVSCNSKIEGNILKPDAWTLLGGVVEEEVAEMILINKVHCTQIQQRGTEETEEE
jgi:hypothetical protein